MEILVNTPGTKLRKDGENLFIENKEGKKRIPLQKIHTLLLGENISITTSSLVLLMKNQVSVFLVNWKNEVIGELLDPVNRSKGRILINQSQMSKNGKGFELSRGWIIEKLQMASDHLKELGDNKKSIDEIQLIIEIIKIENSCESIRGYEGKAGRIYFKELRRLSCSQEEINFRNIKPAIDSFNISLNYTYGILYRKIEQLLILNKLEPTIGFFHTNETGKNSLVFDFIERYRIYFLKRVYMLFQDGVISRDAFTFCEGKHIVTDDVKKLLVKEFNEVLKKRYGKGVDITLDEKMKIDIKELREEINGFGSL
jgi:CRISPR-associated protein Cas1